jgi:uncharacterized protein YraI
MKSFKYYLTLGALLAVALAIPALVSGQSTGVSAEAIQQANLRAATDVNSSLLGQIVSGNRYPVVGRSQYYPWLLLGDPSTYQPIGWVYIDLVNVYGDINTVPYTENTVDTSPPTLTLVPTQAVVPTDSPAVFGVAVPTATLAAQATDITGVIGVVTGEINIRYGPGLEYPRIGVARAGEEYEITARHTQFPWVQIRYPQAPNGYGWVANDLLDIQGDIYSVPATSQTVFDLPTLTPTPPVVQASNLLDTTAIPISPEFRVLGDQLWNMVLQAGFEPETSRMGALFLMDLRSGQAITFGNTIAFSGMSLNKISILATLYSILQAPPDTETAVDIANMMVCSENSASNALLTKMGNGDPYAGAQVVTDFMAKIGLGNTFIVAPFLTDPNATPEPVRAPTTNADQISAQPDYSNQMTVDDLGWLLDGIYQCAFNGNGPLMRGAPGAFDQRECRQMLDVMSSNNMGQPLLMSAGVPANTRVAHKHGWVPDTHGNAGIVFTPGGDFVLVVALHNPTWLDFSESFPLITEIAHTVYNYYNPSQPVTQDRTPYIVPVEDCKVAGSPIVDELISDNSS